MTTSLRGEQVASMISAFAHEAVAGHNEGSVWVGAESWPAVARQLHDRPETDFKYLSSISAVDYIDHFEVVYHLVSLRHNHGAVVKIRCGEGRSDPVIPSCMPVWRGAELQEREAYDLMGVRFEGHPNLKRVMLWEGFPGHPHRKDFLR